jgi:pyrroloquinoline quinone biosynthesis protein D
VSFWPEHSEAITKALSFRPERSEVEEPAVACSATALCRLCSNPQTQDTTMPPPEDSAQPRLAAGCRWGGTEQDRVILFPEGAIKLQGTGRQILERCDGQRTFAQIITELQAQFSDADPAKIQTDISQFLEQLRHKRIVDY